jgi:hypothetical protein
VTANGTAPAPQAGARTLSSARQRPYIDARTLSSARKRAYTAAGKALASLEAVLAAHRAGFGSGDVPPAAGLRKGTDKYLDLLSDLDTMDGLLTPEALEALAAEDTPEPGTVTVGRNDLALLTEFLRDSGLVPPGPVNGDTPLGRLSEAAGLSSVTLAQMASVPVPVRGDGIPVGPLPPRPPAQNGSWYDGDGDDSGWPSQGT